jgi:monoamine oxidase
MKYDVIIIGAGAAGLMAAYQLAISGRQVLILEARDRIGGRIHTVIDKNFPTPVETGAEFVHGHLPITLSFLKKAALHYSSMKGRSWSVKNGKLSQEEDFGTDWEELIKRLNALQIDMTISDFLDTHFNGEEHNELKKSVFQFVQGFDAADPKKVSAFSLRKEWSNEDNEHQYRVGRGYSSLTKWIADECLTHHAVFKLMHIVKQITWQKEDVVVRCSNGETFTAGKVLITVPIGVWQGGTASEAGIAFMPALPAKQEAAMQIGYGNVIKINLAFTEMFWENNGQYSMKDAGFIFSDALFPTWWTQNPNKEPLLNGWLAGPPADDLKPLSVKELKEKAIGSLAYIFGVDKSFVEDKIKACIITNWGDDLFARGAYSYETLQSAKAKKTLVAPIDNTLFFAGEALYDGPNTGTVEAAFTSGRDAAGTMF